ncbi:MAG TPA: hypothetical protein VME45_05455 [Stellaceae bacterium]|nr:hypothetical protein [Stellaceae bacterium]
MSDSGYRAGGSMYSDESCGIPPGGGTAVGGCAAAGSWVCGAAAGDASDGGAPEGAETGVAGCAGDTRFGGLGTGWEDR